MISTIEETQMFTNEFLASYKVNDFSNDQLVELALKYGSTAEIEAEIKKEIFNRGKDNIQERICIKKSLRHVVKGIENQLKGYEAENHQESSLLKSKLLSAVSLRDRLEILWVKHDHNSNA